LASSEPARTARQKYLEKIRLEIMKIMIYA
jgi:hypothetical protein